ncbi:substrate-binding periplasmic protein [Rugamonas sp. CCM 8940]|uniref:substrate-binding periplasmic protein n=1 Tax=Rugamonas sp. CCM 8940 TaxID=2765359 RepID=UPI0018F4BD4A|nr:transporter substrate-binding domain-containing protein [Rugamonas sp. CCM 8940]MBJ7312641.1 transporter substrate-binding domain-containing protein [Rugamonas sp. CCM 8940]
MHAPPSNPALASHCAPLDRRRRAALAWLALLAPAMSAARGAGRLSLTLTSHDYPPFMGHGLPYGGLLTRLVVESFKLVDVDLTFEHVSSNRAITGVMRGIYDGGYGWAHSAERDRKLLYSSNSIYIFRMVFFQRRGSEVPWKKLADLGRAQIGTTLGNYYSDEFLALQTANKLRVQEAASDLANMRKLLLGRIDLFPMEEEAGKMLIQANLSPAEQGQLSFQSNPIATIPTFLVLRRTLPGARELIARFDQGYRQLYDSGQLARLLGETRKALLGTAQQTPGKDKGSTP